MASDLEDIVSGRNEEQTSTEVQHHGEVIQTLLLLWCNVHVYDCMASSLRATSKIDKRTRPSTGSDHDHIGLENLGVAQLCTSDSVTLCHKLCDLTIDELDTSCGIGLLVEPLH